MKAFLFLLFLVLAAGVWFAAPSIDAKKYLQGDIRDRILERAEILFSLIADRFPDSALNKKVEENLGHCEVMSSKTPGTRVLLDDMAPAPGIHFPFAQPADISKIALLCGFPGDGKSVLIVPNADQTTISIRRYMDRPATVSVNSGSIALISDLIDLAVELPGVRLHLHSEKAVSLMLQKLPAQYTVFLRHGRLDVSIARTPVPDAIPLPVLFQLNQDTALLSDGKVISERASMKLLPSGFQEDVSPPPGAPPVAAPPPIVKPGPSPAIPTGGKLPPIGSAGASPPPANLPAAAPPAPAAPPPPVAPPAKH